MRPPPPPTWIVFAASSSRCARVMPDAEEGALGAQRFVVLGDLVRLGRVGVEVVLAVPLRVRRDPAAQRQPDAQRLVDRLAVGDRQHPGVRQADGADVGVRRVAVAVQAPAEHLRLRPQLHVDLEADHRLPRHAARSRQPRRHGVEADRLLERVPDLQQPVLGERGADHLEPDRQAAVEAARDRQARQAGEVDGQREHVVRVHRERVVELRADARTRPTARSAGAARPSRRTPRRSRGGSACGRAAPGRSRRRSSRPTARRCRS